MIGADLVRSAPFRLALILAAALVVVVVGLFGFVYWKTDDYLTARSDQMVTTQVDVLSLLRDQRLQGAIEERLKQDARGVQYAGLFRPDGSRVAGNIAKVPSDLKPGAPAEPVQILAMRGSGLEPKVVQGAARQLPDGDLLVVGRLVDETKGIAHVIGQALALGLVLALCLSLVIGTMASLRARKRVEEVNERVQRIVAGDLRERLPLHDGGEEFSKLAAIVNGMLDEMETMIHALAGVGNDIAHDLRTPLTRARLLLERGRANAATLEQLQATTDKAITGIDQSLAIITALLRLAEIENSRRSAGFGVVALDELLREVFDLYEPIAENKDVTLKVKAAPGLPVHGDRDLLIEAVANLVDNAIKFTPAGGSVDIELIRGDGENIVRISDTGCGISEKERDAVLRRFYRSEKDRNTPGVGLGLNLVAAIVKLHGFRLAIFPAPGCRVEIACPDQATA
jgi:signal transduction histidine kinase